MDLGVTKRETEGFTQLHDPYKLFPACICREIHEIGYLHREEARLALCASGKLTINPFKNTSQVSKQH